MIAGHTKQAFAFILKTLTIPMVASPFILHLHILLKTTPVSQIKMILHKLKFFKRLYTIYGTIKPLPLPHLCMLCNDITVQRWTSPPQLSNFKHALNQSNNETILRCILFTTAFI